jgi:hypothetical protein
MLRGPSSFTCKRSVIFLFVLLLLHGISFAFAQNSSANSQPATQAAAPTPLVYDTGTYSYYGDRLVDPQATDFHVQVDSGFGMTGVSVVPDIDYKSVVPKKTTTVGAILARYNLEENADDIDALIAVNPSLHISSPMDQIPRWSTIVIPLLTDKRPRDVTSLKYNGSYIQSALNLRESELKEMSSTANQFSFRSESEKAEYNNSIVTMTNVVNQAINGISEPEPIQFILLEDNTQDIKRISSLLASVQPNVNNLHEVDFVANLARESQTSINSDLTDVSVRPMLDVRGKKTELPGYMIACIDKVYYENRTEMMSSPDTRHEYYDRLQLLSIGPSTGAHKKLPDNLECYMWIARGDDLNTPLSYEGVDHRDKLVEIQDGLPPIELYVDTRKLPHYKTRPQN